MSRLDKAKHIFEQDQLAVCKASADFEKLATAKRLAGIVLQKAEDKADKSAKIYIDLLAKVDP